MGATSRRKGVAFEQEIARLLTAASGVKWGRTKPGDSQEFGDVVPRGLVVEPWSGLFVECKAHSSVRPGHLLKPCDLLSEWWARTRREAAEVARVPVLFVRFKAWGVAVIVPESNTIPARNVPWLLWAENWCAFDAEALKR